MGLNHQMASLSCSMSEAFYLRRTLVLPPTICLFGLHRERWPEKASSAHSCVPIDELFDTLRLSQLVPIYLRSNRTGWARSLFPQTSVAHVPSKGWSSERVLREYPCGGAAKLVRRHVESFWFAQCTRNVVNTDALATALNHLVGAPPNAAKPMNVLLRSGLFFAPSIKAAAALIRARIGGGYASIHVRRSDKLTACTPADCATRDALTRPEAVLRALRLWIPLQSHLYVGSTEKPAFFAPLRPHFKLHFSDDFPAETANITNNYALYAMETLIFFGSVASVETFGYATSWFADACFPAAGLKGSKSQPSASLAERRGASAVDVQCRDGGGTLVNGVLYGRACTNNPPCGRKMALVPSPISCGRLLPDALLRNERPDAPSLRSRKRQDSHISCSSMQADMVAHARLHDREASARIGHKEINMKNPMGPGKKRKQLLATLQKLQQAQEDHANISAQMAALDTKREMLARSEISLRSELQRLAQNVATASESVASA
ncbi:hypothetical protein AB1Y20_000641 [Prymnesium parvum]|uniref:O-fucosyltransferase family protein n=1 Tax=Prymnesium parvum TaxID=97485 RepID=A0AB34K8K0_PRYPA